MRSLFLILILSLFTGFVSCHNMEEPGQIVKMGGQIDADELKTIHILYDSLKLSSIELYDNWVKYTDDRYNHKNEYYSADMDPFITSRYGLAIEPDSVGGVYHVTKIIFDKLPDRDDISLPDVFDNFKHLKEFKIHIPTQAKIELPASLCECPLITLDTSGRLSGSAPTNFGKLANTLETLKMHSHCGNDFLRMIPSLINLRYAHLSQNNFSETELLNSIMELPNLEYADFSENNFTGKTPYLTDCKAKFIFNYNNFTQFDWRYIEDYSAFIKALDNENIEFSIPAFRHNAINDSLPVYFNEGFFTLYSKRIRQIDIFVERIFGSNPIFVAYRGMRFEYFGYWPATYYR